MWLRLGACVCALALTIAGSASASVGGHHVAGAAGCTTAAASQTATAAGFGVDPISKRTPINSVVCGPFFGAGSQGMAATVAIPTGCGFSIGWGVFRLDGGAWHLVMHQDNGVLKLESVPRSDGGADIRTTQGYPKPGEIPTCATGPSRLRTRVWHWDGARFVASPWAVTYLWAEFNAPAALPVRCVASDGPGRGAARVLCQSGETRPQLFQQATLSARGAVSVCRAHRITGCNFLCGCEEHVPVLKYGQHIDVGRFRCEVFRTGVRCTIISTGRGFLITPRRVLRVG
jgi:hypothetical protein